MIPDAKMQSEASHVMGRTPQRHPTSSAGLGVSHIDQLNGSPIGVIRGSGDAGQIRLALARAGAPATVMELNTASALHNSFRRGELEAIGVTRSNVGDRFAEAFATVGTRDLRRLFQLEPDADLPALGLTPDPLQKLPL